VLYPTLRDFRLIHVIAINEIDIFGTISGLVINRNKTEGLWIGKLKPSKDKEENIKKDNFDVFRASF
jgi:hypothetical protein